MYIMERDREYSKIPRTKINGPKLVIILRKKEIPVDPKELILYKYVITKVTETTKTQYPAIAVAGFDLNSATNNMIIPTKNREEYTILNQFSFVAMLYTFEDISLLLYNIIRK